jgi:hypothetical protein
LARAFYFFALDSNKQYRLVARIGGSNSNYCSLKVLKVATACLSVLARLSSVGRRAGAAWSSTGGASNY